MKLIHAEDLSPVGVSHNPEIKKIVFLEKGAIPQLATFAQATFKPGQFVDVHKHQTMHEVFYIISGEAEFVVEGEAFKVTAGDCVVVEPGEMHQQRNSFDRDVVWIYFGMVTVPNV